MQAYDAASCGQLCSQQIELLHKTGAVRFDKARIRLMTGVDSHTQRTSDVRPEND